ncbi:DUF4124 domain-containing protein [Acidithiobacillus thiooxidans]|nr:DUF4124 domain-containing protein [Acidithiobacillus thiooxidans]
MKKLGVAMLMAVVGYAGMAQATIYEWVENGIDTYSDSPPSAENGMGGHFHGAYTEGGVEVSISRANPEILAANAASNAEYKARQKQKALAAEDVRLVKQEAKEDAKMAKYGVYPNTATARHHSNQGQAIPIVNGNGGTVVGIGGGLAVGQNGRTYTDVGGGLYQEN